VAIWVYDILGRRINTLVDKDLSAGVHNVRFDSCDEDGRNLSSGVYVCRMEAGEFVGVRKLVLLR
jgi:flagellar hook assembly protein FlgD